MLSFDFVTLGISLAPFALVAVGFVAGTLAALLGIGGGLLVTPFLNILGAPMVLVVPTTINYIAGTSLMATLRNRKWGNFNVKAGLITATFMIPSIEASTWLMKTLALQDSHEVDSIIRICFILFLIVTTPLFVWKKDGFQTGWLANIRLRPVVNLDSKHQFSIWVLIPGAILAGFIAGTLGLGGGRVLLPLFMLVMSLDTKVAVGSSSLVIMLTSIYGSVSYGLKGMVDYPAVGFLLIGSLVGAYFGSTALNAFQSKTVKLLYLVLTVAALTALFFKQAGDDFWALAVLATCCICLALSAHITLAVKYLRQL